MRKLVLAFCFSILIGLPAFAQMYPTDRSFTRTANSSVPVEYDGCLQRASSGLLFNSSQGKYYLVSGTVSLQGYVGQNVHIIASNINPGDPSSDERSFASGEPLHQPPTLDVTDISISGGVCNSQ